MANGTGIAGIYRGTAAWMWERPGRKTVPALLTGAYLIVGATWILYAEGLAFLDIMEDLVFTLGSGGVLYWLSGSGIAAVRRKAAELLRSEARLKAFANASDSGIVVTDSDRRVTYVNRAAANILGRTRGNIIGEFAEDQDWARQVLESGRPVYGAPFAVKRPDGSRVLLLANSVPLRDRDGRIAEVVTSFSDITERSRAESFGVHASRPVAFRPVASWIAREVGTPNNVVRSYLPELQSVCDDSFSVLSELARDKGEMYLAGHPLSELREVVPWAMRQIAENSDKIRFVVEKLGEFADREEPLPDAAVDVNEVTRAAVGILRNRIAGATDRFQADYEKILPPVRGSALELQQAVIHLVENALQALPDRGRKVRVSTSVHKELNCVEVRVRDEGRGMSEKTLSRLDEPFLSARHEAGGAGLGLFIARHIVKRHKGTIVFRSAEGKGTTACIFLPAGADGGTRS